MAGAELRTTGYYVPGSRVQLDSIVREYRDGENAATIQSHYPTLSREQIQLAIAFYLDNKPLVDARMEARRGEEDAVVSKHPLLRESEVLLARVVQRPCRAKP